MPPDALFRTALALFRAGQLQEALEHYDALLSQQPDHYDALSHSGLVLYRLGHFDEAAARLKSVVDRDEHAADAWCNLATAYRALHRPDEARSALHQALTIDSNLAAAWDNLASVLIETDMVEEAARVAGHAVRLSPHQAMSWYNLAIAHKNEGKLRAALAAARRANQLLPGQPILAGIQADLELECDDPAAARETLHAAVSQHTESALLNRLYGRALEATADLPAALVAYGHAHQCAPEDAGILDEYFYLAKRLCEWNIVETLRPRLFEGLEKGVTGLSPFTLLSEATTLEQQRRSAEIWSLQFPAAASEHFAARRLGRVRVGYLSADFCRHATAVLVAGLFEEHDREEFEVFGYSTGPDDQSRMRARVRSAFDEFVDARGWTAPQLARRIRDDEIDILVDLKGHTADAPTAVAALRPAPIQVSYLGYPGTTGAPWIDYLIGDSVVIPKEDATRYSEAVIELPYSYQINDRLRGVPVRREPKIAGLRDGVFVFACFNDTYKINRSVFDAWAKILQAVPHAILWLLSRRGQEAAQDRLRSEAQIRGVAPERVVFAAERDYDRYLELYLYADIFLDTWPYNGHTTASDALWAGCPVLTLLGEAFAGRVGASLLHAVGLPEMIAGSVDAYVRLAIELAGDNARVTHMRAHLEGPGRASALFNTRATTRAIEAAYRQMMLQSEPGKREGFRVASVEGCMD